MQRDGIAHEVLVEDESARGAKRVGSCCALLGALWAGECYKGGPHNRGHMELVSDHLTICTQNLHSAAQRTKNEALFPLLARALPHLHTDTSRR
ncbi:unnamed protein product [Arctogadus glacialis]